MKTSAKGLNYFGLDCGSWNSSLESQNIMRTTVVSPAFLEHGSAEKIKVCAHTNRDPNKQED
jgi:hypothetical protein